MYLRVVTLAVALALPAVGSAQDASPGRYAIAPDEHGFVRLDTRTGQASHCGREGDVWVCEPFQDVEARVEDKVDRLAASLELLRAQVEELAASIAPEPTEVVEKVVELEEPERQRFAERAIDRLVSMVRTLKRSDG